MEDNIKNIEQETEINLVDIVSFFKRNKYIIIKIASLSAIVGVLVSLITKRTWRGEFQIVLEENSGGNSSIVQSLISDARVAGFAGNVGLKSKSNQLETEVEILRSPSVLFPIFDFVKQKKEDSGIKFGQSYNMWYNSAIAVNLKRGTSVLTVSYIDNEKNLIIPILEKISKKYQSYSGEKRNRSIDIGLTYLGEQIKKYKKISSDTINKAISFAYQHNLINESEDYSALPKISSEGLRIDAVTKLDIVENQLNQINKLKNDSELVYSFSQNLSKEDSPVFSSDNLTSELNTINNEIIFKEINFKPSDPDLIDLKIKREKLIGEIKKQIIRDLITQREQLITTIEANTKPKEVIAKYGELMIQASKDTEILMSLTANETNLRLKKAEIKEPWKLITKPTLDDYPVAPNRKIIVLVSLIIGLFTGTFFAFFREKRNSIIFSKNEMEKLFNLPLLEVLNLKNKNETEEILQLLAINKLKIAANENIAIIPIGNIDQELLDNFIDNLKNFLGNNNIELTKELSKARLFNSQLIVASLGITKSKEIIRFQKLLNLQNNKTLGWILL